MFLMLHLCVHRLKVFLLDKVYHEVWLGVTWLQKCTRGPEDPMVVVAGPCHTPDPILLWRGQYKCPLQTIGAGVAFLLLDNVSFQ